MTPCEEYAYRFAGLAEFAAESRPSPIKDRHVLNRFIELAREFRKAEQDIPGALIGTEGQTVRGHKEGHEAGK